MSQINCQFRQHFPFFSQSPDWAYLDSAATTLKPQVLIDATQHFYSSAGSVHRSQYDLPQTQQYEQARSLIAERFNAKREEVIWTSGTTHSLNLVAYGIEDQIQAGDEIVISVAEHHANFIPWQQLAERKQAKLIVLPLDKSYQIDQQVLTQVLSVKTKIVAFNLVSNVTGVRQPAEQIVSIIREHSSAQIVVDMAQAVCSEQVDVKKIGADFYAFSAHKMYGPNGVGILIGKFDRLQALKPLFYGGKMLHNVTETALTLAELPYRLEAGTPNMAGIIGLITMSKVVANVVKNAVLDIFSSKTVDVNLLRTQRDVPTSWIGAGILLCTVLFAAYFHFMYAESFSQTIVAFLIVLIMSFLLSVVGISSIAYTGTEPVSGMTIFMIIISAVCLTAAGMTGKVGMIAVLMMASFIGTTIGMAGNFMSELKVAHMTGATPKKMEQWQIVGTILCAVLSVGVMILLNDAYGFVGDHALNAPQANAMAAIIEPMMTGGSAQWPLYMAGALFAIILWMVKVPPLAFALGTYLPMEINTPLLIGGLIAYFVQNSTKDKELADLRFSKGSTIASGLVAGGAIGSLFSAVLRIAGVDVFAQDWVETPEATYLSIVMYLLLCVFLYKVAMYVKAKKAK